MNYAIVYSLYSGPSGPVSFEPFERREDAIAKMGQIKQKAIDDGKTIEDLSDQHSFAIMAGNTGLWRKEQFHLTERCELK